MKLRDDSDGSPLLSTGGMIAAAAAIFALVWVFEFFDTTRQAIRTAPRLI